MMSFATAKSGIAHPFADEDLRGSPAKGFVTEGDQLNDPSVRARQQPAGSSAWLRRRWSRRACWPRWPRWTWRLGYWRRRRRLATEPAFEVLAGSTASHVRT